jgi:hypothetical protein
MNGSWDSVHEFLFLANFVSAVLMNFEVLKYRNDVYVELCRLLRSELLRS